MAKKVIEIEIPVVADVKSVDELTKEIKKMSVERDKATDPRKIRDFNDELKSLEGQIKENKKATEAEAVALDDLGGAAGGAITQVKALGKQLYVLVANPIGAVIAAVALVVTGLFKAFSRTAEGGAKLNKGMTVLSGVFSAVLKRLEPLANFIVDKVVGGFEALGKAASFATDLVSKGLKSLGFEDAAKGLDNLKNSSSDLIEKTTKLADLEAKLVKTRREQALIEKQALIDAENLRQKRDDETNTLKQRIEFNKQLGEVLEKQTKEELAIAADGLKAAQLRLEIDGKTPEALQAVSDAKLEILDIEERINGFQSEQLLNENSLRNEGKALAKEKAEQRKTEKEAKKKEIDDAKALEASEIDSAKLKDDEKLKRLAESQERALELKRAHKLRLAEEGLNDDNLTPDQIRERYEALTDVQNEIFEEEQIAINEKFEAELISKQERDALLADSEINQNNNVTKNDEESTRKQIAFAQAKKAAQLDLTSSVGSALGALGALAEEGTAQQKVLALSEIAIGTGVGFIQGLDIAQKSAKATGPAASFTFPAFLATQFAAVLAAGSRAKGILSTVKGGGASPSITAPSIGSTGRGSASAPSLNDDTLFSTQNLTSNETEETTQNNDVRAYVVESEITDSQNQISDFRTLSEIG